MYVFKTISDDLLQFVCEITEGLANYNISGLLFEVGHRISEETVINVYKITKPPKHSKSDCVEINCFEIGVI